MVVVGCGEEWRDGCIVDAARHGNGGTKSQ